jgi:hypothetical protein
MIIKWKQGIAAVALTSLAALTFASASGAAASKEKLPAWAATEIAVWKELGLLKGNELGNVLPYDSVKKAEFIAFVNRVFNYTELSGVAFKDVPRTAWYAQDISKALAAGVLIGSDGGEMNPLKVLTKEEAAVILSRVFQLPEADGSVSLFKDDTNISAWARNAVYALKAGGYISGTADGSFQPNKALTRAEAVKMIHNAMGALIADGKDHASLSGGNLVVNTAGGRLSDVNLTGNLYIAPGVGEGDVVIENAKIGGTLYVNGGGVNSITLKNSKASRLVIDKRSSPVRVVFVGTTQVQDVQLLSSSLLDNQSENEVGQVIIAPERGGNSELRGRFGSVTVPSSANESTITLPSQTFIQIFTANRGVTVTGEGAIGNAVIQASGVTLAKKPQTLTLNADQATVEGKIVKKGDTTAPAGGGGGSGGTAPNTATQLYTYEQALSAMRTSAAEQAVKQYITFLQDPTYTPSIANPAVSMPNFTNAITFVNAEFAVKPSIFASLRGINTSVLNEARTLLWIGTDEGVTKISLSDNKMTSYSMDNAQLKDNRVLLLIADGSTGVYAITETGVAHIYQ